MRPACGTRSTTMTSTTLRLMRYRLGSSIAAGAALGLAFVLLPLQPDALAQSGVADRWIGTWMTAEVGRPQTPVPPSAPPLAPFMVNTRCPAPPAPPVA